MKYYRLNQIAMAVLGALLLFFGTKTLINIAYEEHGKEGYEVAGTEEKPKEEETPKTSQLPALLASADPARGEEIFKKCAICHTVDKGGANMIGPNLYGVVGAKIAHHEGYDYSPALKAKEGDWTYDNLDHMIESPNTFAPGTKMAMFPGLPDAKERADVIAFLRTKNDNPPPLPEVTAEEPAAEEKPAEEKKAEVPGAEVLPLLATADTKQGEADAALCKVCHTFDKGGATMVGPNLYDIVGQKIASEEGFNFSPALKKHSDQSWTYENLDLWLKNPQEFAPGTTMAFPGVPDLKKRANIIAFLRASSASPAPLPEAAAPTEEKAAPAPEEKPAEPEAPAEEKAAEPEAPAAEPEAPAAEPEAPAAEPEAPAAEPEAPAAEPEAPAAENPEDSWTPHQGEPPSASQPQPVVPEETEQATEPSEDTSAAEPSAGEPPSASQPQPVYPDGQPDGVE
jgi:cytochrome c2